MESRLVPAADYWSASGDAAADWNTGANWSLGNAPTANDSAIFDAEYSNTPCSLANGSSVTVDSLQFQSNVTSFYSTLIVDGTLNTSTLTLNARLARGSEVTIDRGGVINVTGTLTFAGGNISGSIGAALNVTAAAQATASVFVSGTNFADPPTLGLPLTLSAGLDGAANMSLSGCPLHVTANASITLMTPGTGLNFENVPFAGDATATSISSDDDASEAIYVEAGGLVWSNGNCKRIVDMGITLYGGWPLAGTVGVGAGTDNGPLDFTGKNIGGYGLKTWGGTVSISGVLQVDQGIGLNGGTVLVPGGATLVTGAPGAPANSQMYGETTLMLTGTLTSHGTFNMADGILDASGSTVMVPATINVDNGTFHLSGGSLIVTAAGTATGSVNINGDFTGTGGQIQVSLNSSTGAFGAFFVNGNVTLATSCVLSVQDVAGMAEVQSPGTSWVLFSWSEGRNGELSVMSPWFGWTTVWSDDEGELYLIEPD
jgi:hypothetical protein